MNTNYVSMHYKIDLALMKLINNKYKCPHPKIT